MFERILCPVDGSDPSQRALQVATLLARRRDAKLWIMHVVQPDANDEELRAFARIEGLGPRPRRERATATLPAPVHAGGVGVAPSTVSPAPLAREVGELILRSACVQAAACGGVETTLRAGDPAREILSEVEEQAIDVVVMGSRGRSNVAGLLHGSVSRKVASRAGCPCITVT